ncbi:type II toxin-antitoxin system Phd/YefM family antitoxin [Methyloprofundus sp.]|uniref:type II toxin-antitoxin system Phd/YefM family antitoxin n=1 Tax=Methyloprofundus sp. TaxID=2020875 RepID=UPI003D09CCD8
MKTFTATQAKQNFGELLDNARIDDVTILKNGHPFVVVSNANQKAALPDVWKAKKIIIQSYFEGNISRAIALKQGGYKLYRELLEDAWRLGITMPRLDDNEIQRMSDTMSHIFNS